MRKIETQIWLGDGLMSAAEVIALHRRLEEAISFVGGLQQLPRPDGQCDYEAWEEENKVWEEELRDAVKDLVVGLLGRELTGVSRKVSKRTKDTMSGANYTYEKMLEAGLGASDVGVDSDFEIADMFVEHFKRKRGQ